MVSNQQSDPYYQDNPNLSNLIKEFRKNKKNDKFKYLEQIDSTRKHKIKRKEDFINRKCFRLVE